MKNNRKKEKRVKISEKERQSILKGIEQANKGVVTKSSEVHKKAKEICYDKQK